MNDQDYDTLCLVGDFKLVPNFPLDTRNGNIPKEKSLNKLENILETFQLLDIWREQRPKSKQFTWSQKTPKIEFRLD